MSREKQPNPKGTRNFFAKNGPVAKLFRKIIDVIRFSVTIVELIVYLLVIRIDLQKVADHEKLNKSEIVIQAKIISIREFS